MNSCNDGSNAPSYMGDYVVDVSPVPLGMKAAHDPIVVKKETMGEVEVPRGSDDSEAREYLKTS